MKVIIADDHPIFRSGLAFLLESSFDKVDLLSFENGSEVLPNIPLFQPDIILLDIDMPLKNGLDCCAEIKNAYPESKVIILSIHKSNEMVKLAFFNGASGYLIKDNTSEEIVECIQFVLGGKKFLPKVLRTLSEDKNVDVEMSQLEKILFTLTATELKVLKLVSQKYSR